jgi:hypothetical protein
MNSNPDDLPRSTRITWVVIAAFKRLQRQGAFIRQDVPTPAAKPDIFEAKLLGTHRPCLARTPDDEIGVGDPIANMKQGLLVPTLIDEAANEPLTFENLLRLAKRSPLFGRGRKLDEVIVPTWSRHRSPPNACATWAGLIPQMTHAATTRADRKFQEAGIRFTIDAMRPARPSNKFVPQQRPFPQARSPKPLDAILGQDHPLPSAQQ